MADKSQLSTEAVSNELERLRQQKRSFALQRAEGLIDATLQHDLVADLDDRIAKLEEQLKQTGASDKEVSAASDSVETSEIDNSNDNAAIDRDAPSEAATDKPAHAETTVVDEMVAEDESGEKTDEDTHDHPEVEAVTDASDKPEHGDAQAIDEIMANTTTTAQVVDTSKQAAASTVAEVPAVDDADDSSPETVAADDPEPVADTIDEPEAVADKLIIEEEQHPIRRENDGVIQFTKLADDVVVSSAMVKEPDYLDSIHEANVVDIRDITKTYKMGEFELEVLKGVTLQVQKGEFISIMGPSGSGKSTLMNILGALDKPTSGEYFLDATDVSKMDEKQLAEVRNSKIGFVFQSFNLLKRTSALRQVELPLIYGTHKDRTRRAREALEAVGLGQRLDHTPAELSGGQQQRVAIARALVTEPSLILADEPTGNLDSRSGTEVMQIFQKMNRENNITTIFVTHDPWIARHTDRVIMLRDGNIIADQRVKNPLIAGEAERPSEAEELQAIFENTYYGGDEEEYT